MFTLWYAKVGQLPAGRCWYSPWEALKFRHAPSLLLCLWLSQVRNFDGIILNHKKRRIKLFRTEGSRRWKNIFIHFSVRLLMRQLSQSLLSRMLRSIIFPTLAIICLPLHLKVFALYVTPCTCYTALHHCWLQSLSRFITEITFWKMTYNHYHVYTLVVFSYYNYYVCMLHHIGHCQATMCSNNDLSSYCEQCIQVTATLMWSYVNVQQFQLWPWFPLLHMFQQCTMVTTTQQWSWLCGLLTC
jgi:hypothetical protein